MIEYLPWTIAHLGALALTLLCAAGLGNLFLRKSRFHNLVERMVFTVSLGLGFCALVLFILGLLGILYQLLIWILTVAGAVVTVSHWLYSHRGSLEIRKWRQVLRVEQWQQFFTLRHAITALLIFLGVSCWILLLVQSQYPPTNWDSISNHLPIARANLTEHRLAIVPGIPFPVVPLLDHMLFTWALALKSDILAQMVVHTFLMLTALALCAWGKRRNQAALGYAAAAFWLAHPMVRDLGVTAYVDIGLTCFVFLGVYALHVFWDERRSSWWYLGMALLGMGAGTKITGLFFVGLGSLLGLCVLAPSWLRNLRSRRSKKALADIDSSESQFNWTSLVLGGTLAFLILMPWYAFNAYHTGNPFWPMFPQYNRGIWASPTIASLFTQSGIMRGLAQASLRNFLMLYVDFIRYPARFEAGNNLTLFPPIAIWPLAWIVALFNRSVRWWVFWAFAFTVFWYLQLPFIRYWLPVVPIAGLALCESIQWILEKSRLPAKLQNGVWLTATLILVLWTSYDVGKQINVAGLPPATREARQTFLSQLIGYPAVKYVNAHANKTDTVCVLSASWLNYYFEPRVIDLRGALYGHRKPTFRWPDDKLWTQWLDEENVQWLFIHYRALELSIPKQNPVISPFWPDYQIVYADDAIWVFQRKPVLSGAGRK
jgi:hypothetical protein